MLLAAAAVAYMLTVSVNSIPTSMVQMPDETTCRLRALDIMTQAPIHGPVVVADCTPLGPVTPPASAPAERTQEKKEG